MKVAMFVNSLSIGGTEKAACFWAGSLAKAGHEVIVVSLADGPRRTDLARSNIPLSIPDRPEDPASVAACIEDADVIHAHAPGFPHQGDILGSSLRLLGRRIPVVQTNIFGKLQNPAEDQWTDFRLFISWTSCVQAARRSERELDPDFFRRQSVAVYPMDDPFSEQVVQNGVVVTSGTSKRKALESAAAEFRKRLDIPDDAVLFGRFSRPEPNKWTPLALKAFLAAWRQNPHLRLILREPPPAVADELCSLNLAAWPSAASAPESPEPSTSASTPIFLLRATADAVELSTTQMACDAILHTSSIGESFGYGLAEPMALGKSIIANSVPWHDQAQIELVRHGECGLIASSQRTMTEAILRLAGSHELRATWGRQSRDHILQLANPDVSYAKLETALRCAVERRDNPETEKDLRAASKAASNLDRNQWGYSLDESCYLRGLSAKINFLQWQRRLRDRVAGH